MKEEVLTDLGLSKNESKVYISLLEMGTGNPTKISDSSSIHRVNVYDALNRLKEKGLVSESKLDGKKNYQAAPPEFLKNIIREKEMKLDKILPELQLKSNLSGIKPEVEVYEGYDFVRNLFLHFLKKKEDIYNLDVPTFVVNRIGTDFQNAFHKRRIQQKQQHLHIYSKAALEVHRKRMDYLNSLPHTGARYLENGGNENVSTTICGDEVIIRLYHENSSSKPLSIRIKNQKIADAYKANFLILWKRAKEPKD